MKNNNIPYNLLNNQTFLTPDIQQLNGNLQQQNEHLTPELRKYYNYLNKISRDSAYYKKYSIVSRDLLVKSKGKVIPILNFYKEQPIDSLSVKQNELPVNHNSIFNLSDTTIVQKIKADENPITRMIQNSNSEMKQDWYLGILLFSVMLLGWIRLFFNKEMKKFIASAFDIQLSHKVYLEQNSLTQRAALLLNIVFGINFGFFVHLILQFYEIKLFSNSSVISFFVVCGIIFLIYILKFVVYKIMGALFLAGKYFDEYIHQIFLYHKLYGMVLFPIIIGLTYMPGNAKEALIITGVIMFSLSTILRIFRGFQICFRSGVSLFYMILYLCTLEILPFAVLYKLWTLN